MESLVKLSRIRFGKLFFCLANQRNANQDNQNGSLIIRHYGIEALLLGSFVVPLLLPQSLCVISRPVLNFRRSIAPWFCFPFVVITVTGLLFDFGRLIVRLSWFVRDRGPVPLHLLIHLRVNCRQLLSILGDGEVQRVHFVRPVFLVNMWLDDEEEKTTGWSINATERSLSRGGS